MSQDPFHRHLTTFCSSHPIQFLTHICTSSSCNNRLLCASCIPMHNKKHKHSLVPTKELLNDRILDVMDLKAKNQNIDDERFNKANALLEKVEHSLEVMMGLIKNSAFKIHRQAKEYREKVRARTKQKYNSEDWNRFKEYFILNKKNFLSSEAGKLSTELESFAVHYGSIISKIDEDSSNVSEKEISLDIPHFDKLTWEETITKSLKGIEDYYKEIFGGIFPTGLQKKVQIPPTNHSVRHRAYEAKVGSMEMSSMGLTPKSAAGNNNVGDNFSTRNTDFGMAMNFIARKSVQASRRPDLELNIQATSPPEKTEVSSADFLKSSPVLKTTESGFRTARDNKTEFGAERWNFGENASYTARYNDFREKGNEKLMIKGKFELSFGLVPDGAQKSHYRKGELQEFDILNLNKKFVSDNMLPYK